MFCKDMLAIALRDCPNDGAHRRSYVNGVVQQHIEYFKGFSEESIKRYEMNAEHEARRRHTLIDLKLKLLEDELAATQLKSQTKRLKHKHQLKACNFTVGESDMQRLNEIYASNYALASMRQILNMLEEHPVDHPPAERQLQLLRAAGDLVERIHVDATPEWARMVCRRREHFARCALSVTTITHVVQWYLFQYARKDKHRVVIQYASDFR